MLTRVKRQVRCPRNSRVADFAPQNVLRLWEYDVGDTVRQSAFASLRRIAPGEYDLTGDVDVEVTFAGGQRLKVSAEEIAKAGGVLRVRQ